MLPKSNYRASDIPVAVKAGSNNCDLFLFFSLQGVRAFDTFSAMKVAPRIATDGRRAVIERLNE